MLKVLAILFGASFTVLTAWALGAALIRALKVRFYREEHAVFGFITGSACLSLLVFFISMLRIARPGVFLALGLAILTGVGVTGAWRIPRESLPPLSRWWEALFIACITVFGCIYLVNAIAPEVSADGSQYHLGLVLRYLKAHGMYRITDDMYASLPAGAEMLYFFAFAFGRHSAAAMVHLAFLLALPCAMLCYARRFGFAGAGVAAALLVFISPMVGLNGSTAYVDVAVACVAFTMFYMLRIWTAERASALLIPAGLLAGFCFAIKYTAAVAAPYAVGFVAWKTFHKREGVVRPVAVVAGCALLIAGPWMLKNWLWTGNPVAPFYNSIFPNPAMHISQELSYRSGLAHFNEMHDPLRILFDVTVKGEKLGGLAGPVFLLFPLGLLALRKREGAAITLAAAVFIALYPTNIGARFLIPSLPFISLSIALTLAQWPAVAASVVMLHALLCWPAFITRYSNQYAPRLNFRVMSLKAALRIEPEEQFIRRRMGNYDAARMLEQKVFPNSRVFAFNSPPQAYTTRHILVCYQGALNNTMQYVLWTPVMNGLKPKRRVEFRVREQPLRAVRIILMERSASEEQWGVPEVHLFQGGREIPRDPQWRFAAKPNPWEAGFAFDGSPVTRWRTWERALPGMYLEADFGRSQPLDSVVLEYSDYDFQPRLRLEGLDGSRWVALSEKPREYEAAVPPDLRRLASEAVKRNGMDYIIMTGGDYIAPDVKAHTGEWGLTLTGEAKGYLLYRID